MSRIVSAYSIAPADIQEGDVMMFIIKAMVGYRDTDDVLRYRIYRCPYDGPEVQGSRIGWDDMEAVCDAFFSSLRYVGKPG
jgi:hypothetical protein